MNRIAFSGRARTNLASIEEYIERRFSYEAAVPFTEEIIADCNDLAIAPMRGVLRSGVGPGIRRIGGAKGRVAITFRVGQDVVTVLSVRYTGPRD